MTEDTLQYFQQLALSCLSMQSWLYNETFELVTCSCPDNLPIQADFLAQRERIETLKQKELLPAVITTRAGLAWALTAQSGQQGSLHYAVLGPALLDDRKESREGCPESYAFLPEAGRQELKRYAAMLHMAATGENASVYLLEYDNEEVGDTTAILLLTELQNKIRSGDLSYRNLISEALTNRRFLTSLGAVTTDSARKVALLTVDLACQAAMESGLGSRSVDALRSQYLPQLDTVTTGYEIARLCDMLMYHLVRLVRRAGGQPNYSDPVQTCCIYINEHICDRLTLEFLAEQTGYSPDHLSRKFRQEFGEPLKDYILRTKIQRAQLLLTTTAMPVSDIAVMFSFSSSSHFTKVFERFAGDTPTGYRTANSHMI